MPSDKIPIAIICNSLPPYTLHVHQRVAREIPEAHLFSVRTHAEDARWSVQPPAEITLERFSDNVACADQGRHPLQEWRIGGRVIKWIKRHGIKFVVLWGYNDLGRIRILNWCRKQGIPCFIFGDSNIHDERLLSRHKAIFKRIMLRPLLKRAAGAMPCGTAGTEYFRKYGVPSEKIFPFPYEPDYELIGKLPPERVNEVRQRFNLPESRHRLLYSGRLVSVKRVDLLIHAFLRIADRRPLWDLVILGDGELRSELKARVPEPLTSRVIWAGHISDPPVVMGIFRACDVLVLPSDREPWGVVINEAAASGMAIIGASTVGAAVDLVRDGVNGRIFPAGDLAKLTECLLDVTQEGRADQMGAASGRVLELMREQLDPVRGLRRALESVGLLA